jgi:hypothetical protein
MPQMASDKRHWRRRDLGFPPAGYVASESVILAWSRKSSIAQTWSWAPFGRFNATKGDGGQVAVTDGTTATYIYTQDGSYNGKQYFCGDGWLIAKNDMSAVWHSAVPQLAIGYGGWDKCPRARVPAYTRYRQFGDASLPAVWDGAGFTLSFLALVSEHYGGDTIANACAMERFIHGWHYGLLRWEAWSQCGRQETVDLPKRCPEIAGIPGPPPAFKLTDCRTYTNFVTEPGADSLVTDGWP